jgi:hypothetical protein
MKISSKEEEFVAQSELFVELELKRMGLNRLDEVPNMAGKAPKIIEPTIIKDYKHISEAQKLLLREAYNSPDGVAYFMVLNPDSPPETSHPLFDISGQLGDVLPLRYALSHPLEKHPRDFGEPDGTVKVYDVGKSIEEGYREQGETSDAFLLHSDGLGSGGTVETAFLYCDSPPMWGGFTYFQNICRLSLDLARDDPEAFRLLFLPDAITILRPRGKGALKVTCPVLYVNEAGRPQSGYRKASGEYVVKWRSGAPALRRAEEFFDHRTREFSPGSSFIHFSAAGQCCLIRNEVVGHGRTRFINSPDSIRKRCLSRKWFMRRPEDAFYKHVPGISILSRYADLYPEQFGPDLLSGEWLYDPTQDRNVLKVAGTEP